MDCGAINSVFRLSLIQIYDTEIAASDIQDVLEFVVLFFMLIYLLDVLKKEIILLIIK